MTSRTFAPIRPQTEALLSGIRAAIPDNPVGDGEQPEGVIEDGRVTIPYVILFRLPGTSGMEGPLSDPQADLVSRYQLSSIGQTPEQVEYLADRTRAAMADSANFSIPDRRIMGIDLEMSAGPVVTDFDADPPVYTVHERFLVKTTPA